MVNHLVADSNFSPRVVFLTDEYGDCYQIEDGSNTCIHSLELYDSIEPMFITNNYYLNCFIIGIMFLVIILIINAPLLVIRKIRGN